MIETRHVEPSCRWSSVGTGCEEEVFSIPVEIRKTSVAHTIRNLVGLRRLERVNENRAESIVELLCIGNPTTVRRPTRIHHAKRILVSVRIDFNRRGLVDVDVPQIQPFVGVSNLFAVRRPHRRIEKRWWSAKTNFLHFTHSRLVAQV